MARKATAAAEDTQTTQETADTTTAESANTSATTAEPTSADATTLIGSAANEVAAAMDDTRGALEALGVAQPESASTRRRDVERKPLTPRQRAERARRRTELGKKLLAGPGQEGVAFTSTDVELKHRTLATVFIRCYPAADRAISVVRRLGPAFLGGDTMKTANAALVDLIKKLEDEVNDASRNVDAALQQADAVQNATSPKDVELEYVAPVKQRVRSNSPESRRILLACRNADVVLCNADRLYWSDHRDFAEVDAVFTPIRRALINIVAHTERTLRAVWIRQSDLNGPHEGDSAA